MASLSGPGLSSRARYSARMGVAAGLANAMFQQPESAPTQLAAPPAPRAEVAGAVVPAQATGAPPQQRIPRWLVRVEIFLRVMLRMYVGLAVCYAPWSHAFWDQNPVFLQFPTLAVYAANGAVRGIVSGLGLLNLWIAFDDAIHHRDR